MVRNALVIGAAALLLACGGGEEASAPAPEPATQALVAADSRPAEKATPAPKKKKASATDPLAQTLSIEAGDLHVVFTNNLDGEIDPCG